MVSCPTCSEPAVGRCRCPLAHSWCKSGHEWHLCAVHRVAVDGAPRYGCPCECSCKEGQANGKEAIYLQEDSHPMLGPD